MGENPSAQRPRMMRPSWGQVLGIAVLFGTGAAVANHDPLTGIVVATITIVESISAALVLRRRQH